MTESIDTRRGRIRIGRRTVEFSNFDDVDKYAEANGGEEGVRALLADSQKLGSHDPKSQRVGRDWLTMKGESRGAQLALRAAMASERSARWTLVAALAAAVGAIATAAQVWFTASVPASGPQPTSMAAPPAKSANSPVSQGAASGR